MFSFKKKKKYFVKFQERQKCSFKNCSYQLKTKKYLTLISLKKKYVRLLQTKQQYMCFTYKV